MIPIFHTQAHTYQVGLAETDTHIEYFWNALERHKKNSVGPSNLHAIRSVSRVRVRVMTGKLTHVPPYPMKIRLQMELVVSRNSCFVTVKVYFLMGRYFSRV